MLGIELFELARDARAKLLSAERLPGVSADEQLAAGFVLVFDAGRILLSTGSPGGPLNALHLEDAEDAPSGLVSSLEEEPWWRLLGCALIGVEVEAQGRVLRLALETGPGSSRVVTLTAEGEAVRSALATGPV